MAWQVLVVDDALRWQQILENIITKMDCKVHVASSAVEAKYLLDKIQFDLALVDLDLDDLGFAGEGGDLFYTLHEKYPEIPVVAITATVVNQRHMRDLFVDCGIQDFVNKEDFNIRRFRDLVYSFKNPQLRLEQNLNLDDSPGFVKEARERDWDQADFAIITALEKEAKAVITRLENHRRRYFESQDIRTYHLGTVPILDSDKTYRIVVVLLPNMGNISAANAVTDTVKRWNPRFVLMVGIAGGIPQDDLDLGDVIAADQVVGYEYGKITAGGIKPRDHVYPASTLLLDRVRNHWDERWIDQIGVQRPENGKRSRPKLFVGPIASGNKVVASTEFRQQLLIHWPKLIAVEMEAEGVFAAAFDRPHIPPTLIIRGICDLADERKSDEWQDYAANAAAAFVIDFLQNAPVEPLETQVT